MTRSIGAALAVAAILSIADASAQPANTIAGVCDASRYRVICAPFKRWTGKGKTSVRQKIIP